MQVPVIGETLYAVLPTHRVLMLTICGTEKVNTRLAKGVYGIRTAIHLDETPTPLDRRLHQENFEFCYYHTLDARGGHLFSTKDAALQVALLHAKEEAGSLSFKLDALNTQIAQLTAEIAV